jgi:hypothetical protein
MDINSENKIEIVKESYLFNKKPSVSFSINKRESCLKVWINGGSPFFIKNISNEKLQKLELALYYKEKSEEIYNQTAEEIMKIVVEGLLGKIEGIVDVAIEKAEKMNVMPIED